MAGIVYPNFMQSIAPIMQMEQTDRRNALEESRMKRVDEADAREREAGQHVPAALAGDRDALGKVAAASPKTAMALAPHLERAGANQRTRIKEAAAWTGQAAMGILSLPPEQRPQAYAAALEDGRSRGFDLKGMPPQYTPDLDGKLNFYAAQSRDVNKWFEANANRPTPMDGGTATAGGVNSFNIGNVRPVGATTGFQQPATFEDGVRLAVNNVKAYPAKFNGGQPMTLLQIGERWAPKGDGANDPAQWARNVGSIGGLDPAKPLDFNDPATAAAFARGVHGAEHGAGKIMAPDVYARALTGAPQLAQGSDMRGGDASGTPVSPQGGAAADVRTLKQYVNDKIPGARVMGSKGIPIQDKQGRYMVQLPDGSVDFIDMPKPRDPAADKPPAGYRAGPNNTLEFIPGGPADPSIAKRANPMTEGQANAALYADRMRASEKIIAANEKAGLSFGEKAKGAVPGVGNFMVTEDYQKFDQARRDFINAVLRRESGAVISDPEFENGNKQYFPQPGDGPDVLKQKAENRRIAIEGISRAAGQSYQPTPDKPPAAPPAAAPAASPEAAPAVSEGATASNPQTGEKIIFRAGQWTPLR